MRDSQEAFELGLECVLDEWEILNVAVRNGWCGSEEQGLLKKSSMFEELLEFFSKHRDDAPMELEDLLYLVLLDDFGVDAQDGSVVWASKILCELYRDCFKNNHFSGLEELLRRREAKQKLSPEIVFESEETSEDEPLEEESKQFVDEDGWTTVRR